jgi:hypothetical protein
MKTVKYMSFVLMAGLVGLASVLVFFKSGPKAGNREAVRVENVEIAEKVAGELDHEGTAAGLTGKAVDAQGEKSLSLRNVAASVIPGLTAEEQRKANEEANTYILPVAVYRGEPEVAEKAGEPDGMPQLTPEMQAGHDRNLQVVQRVLLNKVGLARINAERVGKGLPALVAGKDVNVAPIGKDVVFAAAAGTDRGISEENSEDDVPEGAAGGGSASDFTLAETGEALLLQGGAGSSVDNSTLQYFPPIGNQGSVDSCVAWCEIYYNLTYETALRNGWDSKNGGNDYIFAPLHTYNFVNDGKSTYTYFGDHYDIAQYNGVVRLSEKPSVTDYKSWVTSASPYLRALKSKTNSRSWIGNLSGSGLQTLKNYLANGHIVSFATYNSGWLWGTIGNDPGTTADDAYAGKQIAYGLGSTSGGHGMSIVGYNDDIWFDANTNSIVDSGEKGALLFANQKGASWKNGGYGWISYSIISNYASGNDIIWNNGVYVCNVRAAEHQPKVVARITVNHTERDQVKCQLGTSSTSSTTPALKTTCILTESSYLSPEYQGGPYAFSGANPSPEDFTYYLDFTDNLPSLGTTYRYYVRAYDRPSAGELSLKGYDLCYVIDGNAYVIASASELPKTVSATSMDTYIEWKYADNPSIVSVTASDASAEEEGETSGAWTITRSGNTSSAITINYSLRGTAGGSDYTVAESPVSMTAGQTSAVVTLKAVDDAVSDEGTEDVVMTLQAGGGYVMDNMSASITVVDNDLIEPVVSTQGSAAVSYTSAELSGVIVSGAVADVWACWGTADGGTVSTGDWEHVQSVGSVIRDVPFSHTVSGLETNTTYRCRFYASNAAGSDWSDEALLFSGRGVSIGDEDTGVPVTAGLVLHLDADDIDGDGTAEGLSESGLTGSTVDTWADKSASARHATKRGGTPTLVPNAVNGHAVVRTSDHATWLDFADITDIRTVFWVVSESPSATSDGFLLGDDGRYHFHRASTKGPMWSSNFANPGVKAGTTRLDGAVVNGTTTPPPLGSYGVISLITTNNVEASQITRDRTSTTRGWNGDIAEILIYNRPLTAEEEQEVGAYLGWKYDLATSYPEYAGGSPIANQAPGAVTNNAATLNAEMAAIGTGYDVTVCWGTTDGGTNADSWAQSASAGSWTNVTTNISYTATGLQSGQIYYYAFRAVSGGTNFWASPSWRFTTPGSAATGYDQWAAGWNADIGASTNDFDGDGMNNLYEYAVGGNPTNPSIKGTLPAFSRSGSSFIYIHPQRSDDPSLVYTVQTCTNLVHGAWTNAGYTITGTNFTGGTLDFVSNEVSTIDNEKFIRVKITQ